MKEKFMSDKNNEMRLIIDRLQALQEDNSMDNAQLQKLIILGKDGLVPEDEVNLVRTAMRTMMADRLPTPKQRDVLLNMLGTLADMITGDMSMYTRLKSNLRNQGEEDNEQN